MWCKSCIRISITCNLFVLYQACLNHGMDICLIWNVLHNTLEILQRRIDNTLGLLNNCSTGCMQYRLESRVIGKIMSMMPMFGNYIGQLNIAATGTHIYECVWQSSLYAINDILARTFKMQTRQIHVCRTFYIRYYLFGC